MVEKMKIDLNELLHLSDRLLEDRLYEITIMEVEAGDYDQAAKARALEEAEGDITRSKALYIKHRVRRLKDFIYEQSAVREIERQQQEKTQRQQKQAETEYRYKLTTAFMSPLEKTLYDIGRKLKK